MKKFIIFATCFSFGWLTTQLIVHAEHGPVDNKPTEKMICDDPAKIEDVLTEKGYFHLLDMKNENGVAEQLWTGGRSMVITVTKENKICLMSQADDVTYNPVTLQKIIEVYKKSQKEL